MKKQSISMKNVLKVVWVLYAVINLIIWIPQVDHLLTKDYSEVSEYISLDDSWDVTINGETFRDVSLEDFHFSSVDRGDQIIMRRSLPEEWDITEAALRLYIRQAAVRIYIDDTLVYTYGYDRLTSHETLGTGFQFINFPKDYQGKTITIRFFISEDKVFTKLDSVRLYEWENAYRILVTENRLPLFLGSFLTIFGLVVCLITTFALVFSRKYIRLFCISVFSICMGLWTLCYYRLLLIFAIPLYSICLLEYISLYLAPFPLIAYMYEDVKSLKQKVFRKVYWGILFFYIAAVAVMMALHMKDIVHLASMLQYVMSFMIVCLIFFMVVILMNFKTNKTANRLYLAGMMLIVFCIAYDMIGYGSERYYGNEAMTSFKGVSSLGVLTFIIILIISFYIEMTQKMMQENERLFLIKSAYTDELTKLHNRRYCMEYMNKLREEKTLDYTVICFDLNNLKKINDTYGHARGDILIKSAADILAETFEEYGVVARMGGDEFIAVLDTADDKRIKALMEQLQVNTAKKNAQMDEVEVSIACGYASGRETGEDIEKVYQTADDRMYEHKKKMKGAAGR